MGIGILWKAQSAVRDTMGNSSATGNSTAAVQKQASAGDRLVSKDNGSLPTLLSSNRQVERHRELAKADINKNMARQRELAKSWADEQKKINEALGSASLAKARIKTANDRLAAYGGSSTSINSTSTTSILGPVRPKNKSWAK